MRPIALPLGALAAALALAGCAEPEPEDTGLVALDARGQLIRVKTDLLGVHPSEVELQAIEEEPELYGAFVDRYLEDPRFLPRLMDIYDARLLMRNGSVGAEEPLRLIEHIYVNDLPFTELVQADYTLANDASALRFSIDVPDEPGWRAGWYEDARPHMGILTMSSVWDRYPSMGQNANRHRANAVSRMLLCDDYLDRPIAFSRNAVDQVTVDPETAIRMSPDCNSCHSTLDPLAAHFFGFFGYDEDFGDPLLYRPENEELWRDYANQGPGYYGQPTSTLEDLGDAIAQDPRFVDCAVRTVWEGLSQRDLQDADWTEIQDHRSAFVSSGLLLRSLVRSVVLRPEYRAAHVEDPARIDTIATVRVVSPAQLASVMEGLTGYRWTFDGRDGLTDPSLGLVTLAGGIDGDSVTTASRAPSVSLMLVHERLAQSAAWHVAENDLAVDREGDARLLGAVTRDDRPEGAGEQLFADQIRHLFLQVTGRPLPEDATEPAELIELWSQIYSVDASPVAAWAGVVSVVLRDPAVLTY